MTSIASCPVTIQTSAQSVPSTPPWFGEVTLIVQHLKRQGVLTAIEEQVQGVDKVRASICKAGPSRACAR